MPGHGAPDEGVASMDVFQQGAQGGRLHMLTVIREAGGPPQLRYSRSDDGQTWTKAIPLGLGQPAPDPAKRGMDIQVAAAAKHVLAVWTAGSSARFGRGPLATAISADEGLTWKPGPNPSDGPGGDHAFVDITADEQGTFHLVWLDSRDGGKGLRYSRSTDGGASWSPNQTLVARTCECCWNTIVAAPGGKLHVLYRQKSPRDMAIISSADGGKTWGAPVTVGAFNWDVPACPHVGGGLACGRGPTMVASVWTASPGATGGYRLLSTDGGQSWSKPQELGTKGQAWRSDVAMHGTSVAVVWDAYIDNGVAVFASTSADGGATWSSPQRLNKPDVSATHPRVVRARDGFHAFWTEAEDGRPTRWNSSPIK